MPLRIIAAPTQTWVAPGSLSGDSNHPSADSRRLSTPVITATANNCTSVRQKTSRWGAYLAVNRIWAAKATAHSRTSPSSRGSNRAVPPDSRNRPGAEESHRQEDKRGQREADGQERHGGIESNGVFDQHECPAPHGRDADQHGLRKYSLLPRGHSRREPAACNTVPVLPALGVPTVTQELLRLIGLGFGPRSVSVPYASITVSSPGTVNASPPDKENERTRRQT